MTGNQQRCTWVGTDDLYTAYHDREWGVPTFEEHRLFEKLVLEGAQAGLSWITILRKRERYRERYHGFDPARVAKFNKRTVESLLKDKGLVRNRLKIESSILNAKVFLKIQDQEGGFAPFVWQYATKHSAAAPRKLSDLPTSTEASTALSKELKRRGMKFVGPTTLYAYMQSLGMVNDHVAACFRRKPCETLRKQAFNSPIGKKAMKRAEARP